jgi:hypothetical protein
MIEEMATRIGPDGLSVRRSAGIAPAERHVAFVIMPALRRSRMAARSAEDRSLT